MTAVKNIQVHDTGCYEACSARALSRYSVIGVLWLSLSMPPTNRAPSFRNSLSYFRA